MTRHRVLHFLWGGQVGGLERALCQLVREQVRLGEWDVGVAFGRAEGPYAEVFKSLGCEVLDLRMRGVGDFPRALRAIDCLRPFDIHHFHALEPCQLLASVRCRDATRVFTQRHGTYSAPEPLRKKVRRMFGGTLLRRYAHAVAGNTRHAARYAVELYGLQHLPSLVTYNGMDFSLLAPKRDCTEIRRELGIGQEDIVVGSSGTFKEWKRFERLVGLLDALPRLEAILVGDGSCRNELEKQADSLGVRDRFHITGLTQDVADYLQAMDVFVLPSTADESFGNSVVEAMALGIPSVVFADSPGVCEHIQNENTGFIVDDQTALTALVSRLAVDPGLRRRVGNQGSQHVRSTYSLENMNGAYRDLYNAALRYQSTSCGSDRNEASRRVRGD